MVHGKMGCVMASYLKVLPMWLIVFPGMIARILYPSEVACNQLDTCERSCQRESGCHDIAYPLLVVRVGARPPRQPEGVPSEDLCWPKNVDKEE